MSLRTRTLIFLTFLILILSGLTFFAIRTILVNNSTELENHVLTVDMDRIDAFISHEQKMLGDTAMDWGHWDDTYNFVKGEQGDYVDSNLTQNSLDTLQLSSLNYFDLNKGSIYSLTGQTDNSAHPELKQLLSTLQSKLMTPDAPASTGIITLSSQPCLYAAIGITDSNNERPVNGFLIMTRLIDSDTAATIADTLNMNATMTAIGNDPTVIAVKPLNIKILTDNSIQAEDVLTDYTGKPAVKVTLLEDRPVYNGTISSLPLIVLAITIIALFTGVLIYSFLQHDVIRNLNQLMIFIRGFANNNTPDLASTHMEGEYAKVAETLLTMSSRLVNEEQKLSAQNQQLTKANQELEQKQNELTTTIKEVKELNDVTIGRELKMVELKKEIDHLKQEEDQAPNS